MKKILLVLSILFVLFGCSNLRTNKQHFVKIDQQVKAKNYAAAIQQLKASKADAYSKKDRVNYWIDLGLLYHYNKQYAESNKYLTQAENAIEELFTKSVSRAAGSFLLNDNVKEYAGEDHEDIYINVFKALNYMHLNQFDASFVEIRRIDNKLKVLEEKYGKMTSSLNSSKDAKRKAKAGRTEFHNSALARYLSMLVYRADGDIDGARIDLKKIKKAFEDAPKVYNFKMPSACKPKNSKNTKLNVLAFAGMGPDKTAQTLWIHSEKDKVFVATAKEAKGKQKLNKIETVNWKGIKPGYHFKFQLPKVVGRKSKVAKVTVSVDGKNVKTLEKLESIDNVAIETFKVKRPIIYIKTFVRSIVKGIAAAEAKKAADKKIKKQAGGNKQAGAIFGALAGLAVDVANDMSENADLRAARYLPKSALVAELEVKPGNHTVTIEYFDKNGTLLYKDVKANVNVKKGGLNTVESYLLN